MVDGLLYNTLSLELLYTRLISKDVEPSYFPKGTDIDITDTNKTTKDDEYP